MRILAERKPKTALRYLQVLSQVKLEMTMDLYIDEKDKEPGRARLNQGSGFPLASAGGNRASFVASQVRDDYGFLNRRKR